MNFVDNILNRVTMYRLILYFLIALEVVAVVLGYFGKLPYSPTAIIGSAVFLIAVCVFTNEVFAKALKIIVNIESVYVTALILALITTPGIGLDNLVFIGWAGGLAISSKYILSINKKHIFNPVALAVAVTALAINQSASWWVGTADMLPFVLIGGFLIVRKIHRADLVWSFIVAAIVTVTSFTLAGGSSLSVMAQHLVLDSPLFFLAAIMLTEPFTTPPTKSLQIVYGILVGILFAPQIHLGSFYFTPELALLAGNVFSYIVSPKMRLKLELVEKKQIGNNIYDFIFKLDTKLNFKPGQYLEWTLDVPSADSRGNRRYFTIASSPTEDTIRMGVKFNPEPSTFKQVLQSLRIGDTLLASQLAGSFTLPSDKNKKLVLIAGGIGITPYRSMVKDIIDTEQKRDIVLLYSSKTADEIVYTDVFSSAIASGVRPVYILSDTTKIPANWQGETGSINEEMILREVPDYLDRRFYLSGPHGMVSAFEKLLKQMNVPRSHIKTDYFPGFA